jgi:hypothetical protein
MPIDARTPLAEPSDVSDPYEKRIVQIELKTALQPLGIRAQSPSSFRFTAEGGLHIAGMHEIALKHELHSAHPAFHLRYPGKMRRRKKGDKALLSRFVHLHFPAHADVKEIVRRQRELPEVAHAAEYRGFSAPSGGTVGLAAPVFPADPLLGTADQPDTAPATGLDHQWYIFRFNVNGAWTRVSGNGVVWRKPKVVQPAVSKNKTNFGYFKT